MADNGFLTIREAALVVGVTQATLRKWTADGQLPEVRTRGGHRRYSMEALQAFIEEGAQRPAPPAPAARPPSFRNNGFSLLALPALLLGAGDTNLFAFVGGLV
jgi:excisionase family DNA binding protein